MFIYLWVEVQLHVFQQPQSSHSKTPFFSWSPASLIQTIWFRSNPSDLQAKVSLSKALNPKVWEWMGEYRRVHEWPKVAQTRGFHDSMNEAPKICQTHSHKFIFNFPSCHWPLSSSIYYLKSSFLYFWLTDEKSNFVAIPSGLHSTVSAPNTCC